jgi:formamidase
MRIGVDSVHYAWDNALAPVVTITSGDTVELDLLDASAAQLTPDSKSDDVPRLSFDRVNPVTGPVRIDGARAGDAVHVTLEELDVGPWGWAAAIPGFGLLADEFPDPELVHATVDRDRVELSFGVTLPLRPMIGTLGVALPAPGPHPLLPPSRWGGNLDVRHVTRGTTITLPVGVDGALLSIGDTHATMGDGEVCGTGVETSGRVVVRVDVESGAAPPAPVLEVPASTQRTGTSVVTTGVGPDLMLAAKDATRSMIDLVVRRTGIAPVHAYVLCSLTADLVINEIVDVPNWVVSLHLPASAVDS